MLAVSNGRSPTTWYWTWGPNCEHAWDDKVSLQFRRNYCMYFRKQSRCHVEWSPHALTPSKPLESILRFCPHTAPSTSSNSSDSTHSRDLLQHCQHDFAWKMLFFRIRIVQRVVASLHISVISSQKWGYSACPPIWYLSWILWSIKISSPEALPRNLPHHPGPRSRWIVSSAWSRYVIQCLGIKFHLYEVSEKYRGLVSKRENINMKSKLDLDRSSLHWLLSKHCKGFR